MAEKCNSPHISAAQARIFKFKRLQFAKMQVRQLLFEMEFLKLPAPQPPVLGSSAAAVNCGHVS